MHSPPLRATGQELAGIWRFPITASSLSSALLTTDHYLLATHHSPLAPDSLATTLTLHAHQRGQVVRRPFPAGYCHSPTAQMPKTERDRISTSGPSIFSMSPNRAIASGKSNFSSPLATRPLTIRSWPEALNAKGSRRAGRMPICRTFCSLALAQENTVHGRTGRILGVR